MTVPYLQSLQTQVFVPFDLFFQKTIDSLKFVFQKKLFVQIFQSLKSIGQLAITWPNI